MNNRAIRIIAVVLLSLLGYRSTTQVVAQHSETKPAQPTTLFTIGTPDARCAEFGLVRTGGWQAYLKVFPNPVVYVVGKSKPEDLPFLHPSHNDSWAGGRAHTFTIKFESAEDVNKPLSLTLGLAGSHPTEPSKVAVTVNGKELPPKQAPCLDGSLAFNMTDTGEMASMVFELPPGAVKRGENSIAITLSGGSWIIYDYIALATIPNPGAQPLDLMKKFQSGPLKGVEEIVFAARVGGWDHYYVNFGYYAEDCNRRGYGDGGRLCKLNLRTGKVTTLIDDPQGGVRDPQAHCDGKTILFSYRKGGQPYYHLYTINADGTGLKQITDGPHDDIEPTYLPDGGIMFVSSRGNRWVNCWLSQVGIVCRCDGDGKNIRMISTNNNHDNTPWALPDGRIVYTRWEYVDRSQVDFHHLWVMNPDGTQQTTFFGNMFPGTVMIDAKPIPGTKKIVASFSPGHGAPEHAGSVTIVDPNGGPDHKPAARRISRGSGFRDPYALSEDCFLVASDTGLHLMDGDGRTQTIYQLPASDRQKRLTCHEPRPLVARPREPVIPSRVDLAKTTGKLILVDAAFGRNMAGVKAGEIKKLLVLELLPKPINFTGGMEPISYGGTFTLERVLGTIPVEPDGSAHAELPAMRSLFFVALDENDMPVKRMQSFVTLQPGETTTCIGCHEHRTTAPPQGLRVKGLGFNPQPSTLLLALRRAPSPIEPIPDMPDVFDFPRDVQPILDRHCVKCHDYDKREGKVILTGDRGPMFSHSYFTLTLLGQFADGRNAYGNRPPRSIGSSASPLMKKVDGSHYGVKLSDHERKMLRLWIETGAAYPGTYAALGTGMLGEYRHNALQHPDLQWASTKAAIEVMNRRCATCHGKGVAPPLPQSATDDKGKPPWEPLRKDDHREWLSRHLVYNLSRPEKSLLLLAPLAKEAGGYGVCGGRAKLPLSQSVRQEPHSPVVDVFPNTNDADYQTLLASIRDAKKYLDDVKRFDMPGFRPNESYAREMRRYGIGEVTDPYAADRAYWASFWHKPSSSSNKTHN
jgi:hypothetical protein